MFRARSSCTWSMREALPRQGFTQHIQVVGSVMPWRPADAQASATPLDCAVTAQIAHRKYAAQYARLVRIWVRTGSRFALLVRTLLREPGRQPVIKIYGCQALVSTVVSRVLQWFPLATWPGPDQTHGAGSTGRRARPAPALSVEFNTPCRSQHAGAGIYFDHSLTVCETGIRPKPRRVGV
ncbi:hypothetical protein C4K00_0212 [Pseudomonas synxantha]|nr:hypothetical protein C4K00_0212 [Pseudomonas synxantha]